MRMTPHERMLWQQLRKCRIDGFKFLRQYVVVMEERPEGDRFFILDFYCAEKRLGIELDGRHHTLQAGYDQWRDARIAERGIRVVRFTNEALRDMDAVIARIRKELAAV